jgi:hypothetical protein
MRSAGEGLDAAASYLDTHDFSQIYQDATDWTKRNPGAALAAAVALGVFVGLAIQAMQPRRVVIRTRESAYED